jgi:hypothetical protein
MDVGAVKASTIRRSCDCGNRPGEGQCGSPPPRLQPKGRRMVVWKRHLLYRWIDGQNTNSACRLNSIQKDRPHAVVFLLSPCLVGIEVCAPSGTQHLSRAHCILG